MKHILIVGPGVCVPLGSCTNAETLAYVPEAASQGDMSLSAEVARLRYYHVDEAFRLSPQTVRMTPTLRQMRLLGSGVYGSLSQEFVDTCNWQEMRGVRTELLTAYLLARALGAAQIRWLYFMGRRQPEVTTQVCDCLKAKGVELCFKQRT